MDEDDGGRQERISTTGLSLSATYLMGREHRPGVPPFTGRGGIRSRRQVSNVRQTRPAGRGGSRGSLNRAQIGSGAQSLHQLAVSDRSSETAASDKRRDLCGQPRVAVSDGRRRAISPASSGCIFHPRPQLWLNGRALKRARFGCLWDSMSIPGVEVEEGETEGDGGWLGFRSWWTPN